MDVSIYLYGLLGAAPLLLIWLIGAILCLYHARWNRRACTLTGIALAVALFTQVVFPWVTTWIFRTAFVELHEIRWRVLVNSLMDSAPHAVIWGLLLWAVFGTSRPAVSPSRSAVLDEQPESRLN